MNIGMDKLVRLLLLYFIIVPKSITRQTILLKNNYCIIKLGMKSVV